MAKIPVVQFQTATPDANLSSAYAGAGAGAEAQMYQKVSEAGSELAKKASEMEASNYAFKSSLDMSQYAAERSTELKMKVVDGGKMDPQWMQENGYDSNLTYSQVLEKDINDRYSKLQNDAPTETARQLLVHASSPSLTQTMLDASNYQIKSAFDYSKGLYEDNVQSHSQFQLNNPNKDQLLDSLNSLHGQTLSGVGRIYDQATAKTLDDKGSAHVVNSYLEGVFNKMQESKDVNARKAYAAEGISFLTVKGVGESRQSNSTISNDVMYSPQDAFDAGKISEQEKNDYLNRGVTKIAIPVETKLSGGMLELHKAAANYLSDQEQFQWLKRFNTALASKDQHEISNYKIKQANYQAYIEHNPNDVAGRMDRLKELQTGADALVSHGLITPEAGAEVVYNNALSVATSVVKNQMAFYPEQNLKQTPEAIKAAVDKLISQNKDLYPNIASKVGVQDAGFSRYSDYENELNGISKQLLHERQTDLAGYVEKYSPTNTQKAISYAFAGNPATTHYAISALEDKQREMGYTENQFQYLSKAKEAELATKIKESANADQLVNNVKGLINESGDRFDRVWKELTDKRSEITDKYKFIGYMKDPLIQRQAANNAINGAEIDKSFKENLTADTNAKVANGSILRSLVSDMNFDSTDKKTVQFSEMLAKNIELEAKRRLNIEKDYSAPAVSAAYEKVKREWVDGQFVYISGPDRKIFAPNIQPAQKDNINSYIDSIQNKESLMGMDIAVPLSFARQYPMFSDRPQEIKSRYIDTLLKSGNMVWTNNGEQTGVYAYSKAQDAGGLYAPIVDSHGRNVSIPFSAMTKPMKGQGRSPQSIDEMNMYFDQEASWKLNPAKVNAEQQAQAQKFSTVEPGTSQQATEPSSVSVAPIDVPQAQIDMAKAKEELLNNGYISIDSAGKAQITDKARKRKMASPKDETNFLYDLKSQVEQMNAR
jgi:hypothetical protein